MELFKASNQWATRPADERFWNLEEMTQKCLEYAQDSVQSTVRYGDLRAEARDGDLFLIGKQSTPARLTHYSMGQLSARVKAPAGYLRTLPATLAAQNLNRGLARQRDPDDQAKLLLHKNGGLLARCLTGEKYRRIWNWEIGRQLLALKEQGWRTPPARPVHDDPRARPATQEDIGPAEHLGTFSVKVGDMIGPAGIYASDRDVFVFLVNDSAALRNPLDSATPLARGVFVWNSEVGDKSFGIMSFLYDHVCGNHIVWGASQVKEFRIKHVGRARYKASFKLKVQLRAYADSSVSEDQAKLTASQTFKLGSKKDEVLSELLKYATKRRLLVLNPSNLEEAYNIAASNPRYGDPCTPWAMAAGVTEISQKAEYASTRTHMDRAAGKILEIAF